MLHYIEYMPGSINATQNRAANSGSKPYLHPGCNIVNSQIGQYTEIMPNASIRESEISDYSYVGFSSSAVWSTIGKFCALADNVRVNPGNHPVWRATQHHSTYRRKRYDFDITDDHDFFAWRKAHWCTIGHDAWIGTRTTIIAGVKIGIGAVIGAGSVVTKDVADYEVVAGRPARHIKMRFSTEIAAKIMACKWWDWPYDKIKNNFHLFSNPTAFIEADSEVRRKI